MKIIQSEDSLKSYLPESLHTFEFLPKPLRSLEPYDKILTSFPCCKKYSADPEDQHPMSMVVINKKPETFGSLIFCTLVLFSRKHLSFHWPTSGIRNPDGVFVSAKLWTESPNLSLGFIQYKKFKLISSIWVECRSFCVDK